MAENKRKIGSEYEKQMCELLVRNGMSILARNYRAKFGEIDIIARDNNELVFIEVKYRKNEDFGGAHYAISKSKQHTIGQVAKYYMLRNHINPETFCRFDALLIDNEKITHIKNAWQL